MAELLSDLDELILKCRAESSKSYVSEALASYRAGANRAAIVTTWIAVILDILEKIQELALDGDAKARAKVAEFESLQDRLQRNDPTALEAALKFERGMLEVARDDFGLLDGQEFVDLERLRQDRHRCAHPTFQKFGTAYQPSGELARTHIRNAVVHLLQHPPVQGKAALEVLRARVGSDYFPRDFSKARQNLAESALRRPTEPLVRGFVDLLFFGLFEKGSPLRAHRRTISALQATLELHRNVAQPRLEYQIQRKASLVTDDDLHILAVLAANIVEVWNALQPSDKERLETFVRQGLVKRVFKWLPHMLDSVGLRQAALDRIATASQEDLGTLLENAARREAIPRAIELFTSVQSWSSANSVADKVVLPLATLFSESDVEQVLQASGEGKADLRGSGGFQRFLDKLREADCISTEWLNVKLQAYGLGRYVDEQSHSNATSDIEAT